MFRRRQTPNPKFLARRRFRHAASQPARCPDLPVSTLAAAIIYVLPPIALLFALRRYVAASLTMDAVTT
jgi:hypothetical protein